MDPLTKIQGQVERITFVNNQNGFTIAKMKIKGEPGLVTVIGTLPDIHAGETLEISGEWVNHPRYGRQFKIAEHEIMMPATASGIEKYLGSGLVKGIGPVMAKQLVNAFGEGTLEIIDKHPGRILEVEGIGPKRVQMITAAWEAQKEIRNVMIFLQGHGVSTGYATKIYRHYGKAAVKVVRDNPYRLADDIIGIGFIMADKIAGNMGIDRNSPLRAEAGIRYCLNRLAEEGHVFFPYEELIEKCRQMLDIDRETIVRGFTELFTKNEIVIEDINEPDRDFKPNNKAVYLGFFHTAESGVAKRLKTILSKPSVIRPAQTERAADWVQGQLSIVLEEKQVTGVTTALGEKVMVLTGGPGTGKTTIIHAIIELYKRATRKIVLGAPTGRAAKRMAESTRWQAKTLHRLLEWDFKKGGFKRDRDNPLDTDVVILDEVSMIDNMLMYHFLRAVPDHAVLILVGDVNQLPSVGAGNVFKDIIDSGVVPVVRLNKIFRQAAGSLIITNAHRINQGEFPEMIDPASGTSTDFYFVEREHPEAVQDAILDLVTARLPSRFSFHPLDDIQVLTPMHKGIIGAQQLNESLQKALNPSGRETQIGARAFRVGDKVMQIRNNYDRDVFNGDIGTIKVIDQESRVMGIRFDGRLLEYDFGDLDEIVLAYAVSIHKSQGSEYPAVVVPIHTTHYVLLQRNLLYTAVTRAKSMMVLAGTRRAIGIAVRNDRVKRRFTRLKYRLQEARGIR